MLAEIEKQNMLFRFNEEKNDCSDVKRLKYLKLLVNKLEEKKSGELTQTKNEKDVADYLKDINDKQFLVRWTKLKSFQRVDRISRFMDQYKLYEGYGDTLNSILAEISSKAHAKLVDYDSQTGKVVGCDLVKVEDNKISFVK